MVLDLNAASWTGSALPNDAVSPLTIAVVGSPVHSATDADFNGQASLSTTSTSYLRPDDYDQDPGQVPAGWTAYFVCRLNGAGAGGIGYLADFAGNGGSRNIMVISQFDDMMKVFAAPGAFFASDNTAYDETHVLAYRHLGDAGGGTREISIWRDGVKLDQATPAAASRIGCTGTSDIWQAQSASADKHARALMYEAAHDDATLVFISGVLADLYL